ncbi:MAG: hypothetical protein MUF31_14255 [Akkermansiaceae bacterium]|jgi:hypothetical protein|nr:hypothetical protein [Akkermansiaceae bacterium]
MKALPALCLALTLPASAAISIDGSFADWSAISPLATDPVDAAANPETDFLSVKVASDETYLYLYYQTSSSFDLNATGFRYNVMFDIDRNAVTGHKLFGASAGGFERLFQGATLYTFQGQDNTNEWNWAWSPTLGFGNTGNEAEFAIALADLGVTPGGTVDFIVFGDNTVADLVPDAFGSSVLSYTTVPEPGIALMSSLAALGILRRRAR